MKNILNNINGALVNFFNLVLGKCKFSQLKIAAKISLIYLILGAVWIFISDKLAYVFIKNVNAIIIIGMFKGWLFVILSSALIFYLVNSYMKLIYKSREEVERCSIKSKEANKELKESQKRLYRMTFHDELTGFYNRAMLYEDLKNNINNIKDSKQALILIDMDNFKIINDTMGHFYGDKMIAQAGERLSEIMPESYNIYRLGGDEFIIYIKDYADIKEIEYFAGKITNSFRDVFNLNDNRIQCTVSIGIALYPSNATNPDDLLKFTDVAMFKAKELGRDNYVFYNNEMHKAVNRRMLLGYYLRTALENGEFEVYYQPQLDIQTNTISGFEALLRWTNPHLGSVSPTDFIGIAEETRQIISIGDWVLTKACSFLKEVHKMGYENLLISVNISVLQLLEGNFVERVLEILKSEELNPQYLELEITESILIESYDEIVSKLIRLRKEGIKIAMDDFGKGYSSLSGLKQLPVNTLKIDKAFIDNIGVSKNDISITESIILMGRRMGMTVLAEGVETKEQFEFLYKYKCHKIQGYIVSRPIPRNEVFGLLGKRISFLAQ